MNIMRVFFEYPEEEFGVRKTARILGIAPASASKELKKLAAFGLLREKKEHNMNLYSAALENEIYRDMKIFYTIWKIRSSGVTKYIQRELGKCAIVLVGMGAMGLDNQESGINLIIFSEKNEKLDFERFSKKINRELKAKVVGSMSELNEEEKEELLNGVVIEGILKKEVLN